MPVPKTAMDKQGGFLAGEHQVRRPGKLLYMKPEPVAESVRGAPDQQLRLGSFPPDATHDLGATGWGDDIYH